MNTKGKITDIYELKTISPTAIAQRFAVENEKGEIIFINAFNNVELLKDLKINDVVEVEFNPRNNEKN